MKIIYILFALSALTFSFHCEANENEVVVANQAVNLDSLYCKPEVFLVKVTEVNTKYNYCKGLIGNNVCYIEPINSDTSRLSTDYKPLQVGDYYLMALVYSNPELLVFPISNIYEILATQMGNKSITLGELMYMLPDTFIAVNMAGNLISPIYPRDLIERQLWPDFTFHPDIPSIFTPSDKMIKVVKEYLNNTNLLTKINLSGYFEYYYKHKSGKSSCPSPEFQIPNKNSELPRLRYPSSENCKADTIAVQPKL